MACATFSFLSLSYTLNLNLQSRLMITVHQTDCSFSCEGGKFSGREQFPEVCQIPLENYQAASGVIVIYSQCCSPKFSHASSFSRKWTCAHLQVDSFFFAQWVVNLLTYPNILELSITVKNCIHFKDVLSSNFVLHHIIVPTLRMK